MIPPNKTNFFTPKSYQKKTLSYIICQRLAESEENEELFRRNIPKKQIQLIICSKMYNILALKKIQKKYLECTLTFWEPKTTTCSNKHILSGNRPPPVNSTDTGNGQVNRLCCKLGTCRITCQSKSGSKTGLKKTKKNRNK